MIGNFLLAGETVEYPYASGPGSPTTQKQGGILINLSNPANPRLIGRSTTVPRHYETIVGTIGYGIAFDAWDLSDPLDAKLLGAYVLPAHIGCNFAFPPGRPLAFASGGTELLAIDMSRPGQPDYLKGRYLVPGVPAAIAAVDDMVYVIDETNRQLLALRYLGDWPAALQDAAVVESTSTVSVQAGKSETIPLTLRNTGSAAWSSDLGFKLGVVSDASGIVQTSYARIGLPAGTTVQPGQTYTFSIPLMAPSPGSYAVQVQMVQENVAWFGPQVQTAVNVGTAKAAVAEWTQIK